MIFYLDPKHFIDTSAPIDLSLALSASPDNPRAWYVDAPRMEPVRANGFIGSVAEGGAVNFRDVFFNPHGHGTHTECCGHITQEVYAVNDVLKEFFYRATLVTVDPVQLENGDLVVQAAQIAPFLNKDFSEALLIRTLPNGLDKKSMNYSGTNPCYLDIEIVDL